MYARCGRSGHRRSCWTVPLLVVLAVAAFFLAGVGQGCSDCSVGTDLVVYVGSDPDATYQSDGVTKAVAVTNTGSWIDLPGAATCGAEWVWTAAQGEPASDGEIHTFHNTFTIPTGYTITGTCLAISADDKATVKINGNEIGTHQNTPGSPTAGTGWDEISTLYPQANVFNVGANDLSVTVEDLHGITVGGVWCLRICLSLDDPAIEACPGCPAGTSPFYVGSDPSSTYLGTTNVLATEVTVSPPIGTWSVITSSAPCGAQWVWKNAEGWPSPSGTTVSFENRFDLPSPCTVVNACLELSADDEATATLNGHLIGTHDDSDVQPSGGPSGWDEVSAFDVDPSWFLSAGNTLKVDVEDTGGVFAGAVWCLKACCSPSPPCDCGYWEDQNGDGCPDMIVAGTVVNEDGTITVSPSDFPITLSSSYSCAGGCTGVSYDWSASGTTAHLDDQPGPIVLQSAYFNGPGTYEQFVTPSCDDVICDVFHFTLVITGCCNGWETPIVHLSSGAWGTQLAACGGTITVPYAVCQNQSDILLQPFYDCDTPGQNSCGEVSFTITTPQGTADPFPTSYTLPLSWLATGSYGVTIDAYCGGEFCGSCQFKLECETQQPCSCDAWDDVVVTWTDGSGAAQSATCTCGAFCAGIFDLYPSSNITVTSSIDCLGTCSPPLASTSWTVATYPGMTLPSPSLGNGLPATFTPQGAGWNSYDVTLGAACGSLTCPDCTIYLRVNVPGPEECPPCPDGTTAYYVGSDPATTYVVGSPGTTATEVTGSPPIGLWAELPSAGACGAKWVWLIDSGGSGVGMSASFSNEFTLPDLCDVVSACLEISADDKATVTLNGHLVGTHDDTAGSPTPGTGWDEISAFDVDPSFFISGTNSLQVDVQDTGGTYAGATWCLKICCAAAASCCAGWASPPMHLSSGTWGTQLHGCGETVMVPAEICDNPAITITPFYNCATPGQGMCPAPSYTITTPQGTVGFQTSFDLPTAWLSGGCYTATIEAYCGTEYCDSCRFVLCCQGPSGCDCDAWDSPKIELATPDWNSSVDDCGATIHLPEDVCKREFLIVTPHYRCDPNSLDLCPVSYEINDPGLGWQSFAASYSFPVYLISGSYEICVKAYCDGAFCDECCFTIVCGEPGDCQCGEWGATKVLLEGAGGYEHHLYQCRGIVTVPPEVCAHGILDITPDYTCVPNDPETCPVIYEINDPVIGAAEFTGTYPFPIGEIQGDYEVCIHAYCGDELECELCCFNVECEPAECQCAEWSGLPVELSAGPWDDTAGCGEAVLIPPEIWEQYPSLTFTPDYICAPPSCAGKYYIHIVGVLEDEFEDEFTVPFEALIGLGEVEVCILPFCGDNLECEMCCFMVILE